MTQFIRAALLGSGLLLNLSACSGGPTAEPHEDAHEEGEDHDEHADDGEKKGDAPPDDHPDEAATAQTVLQVSDDLKRDLRVSTVVVSATVGAERVVILGELRAHEDALLEFAGSAMIISHDRWFLDRICTHILACEGDSQWFFYDGNYQEYEADKKKRLGDEGARPKRVRFKPIR